MGSPALTTRGFTGQDFEQVVDFIDEAIQIGLKIQTKTGKSLKNFVNDFDNHKELIELKNRINTFAVQFEFYS